MQEMSLLLQKENEPEQKKNQQALSFPACAWQRVGGRAPLLKEAGLLRVLRMGGLSSWAVGAGGWGHSSWKLREAGSDN